MAKDKKNTKKEAKKELNPPKKGGMWVLALILILSSAATGILIIPAVQKRALRLFKDPKAALSTVLAGNQQQNDAGATAGADATLKLQDNLAAKFTELKMRGNDTDYTIRHYPKDSAVVIGASLPRGRPIEWMIMELAEAARSTPYAVDDCFCASEANCTITFKSSNPKHYKVVLNIRRSGRYLPNSAKMAIIIEDFGFEANQTTIEYLSFPEPLTVSLVPARRLAEWTARIADEYKKEVVLLLPMEPLPPKLDKYRESMIKIHHSDEEIRSAVARAAAAIPNFSGIANYHGTRAMEDSRVMGIVLSEASKRKAYFAYAYTDMSKSVVPQIVKTMKTPSAQIQGSFDADITTEQARGRLYGYAAMAEKTGRVLIKAQPSPAFIQVLKEETEALKRNGISLVYVSELVK